MTATAFGMTVEAEIRHLGVKMRRNFGLINKAFTQIFGNSADMQKMHMTHVKKILAPTALPPYMPPIGLRAAQQHQNKEQGYGRF